MLGDAEHPVSFAFEPRLEGAHVKVRVRAGLRGTRALAGELTFRPEEWAAFREVVGQAEMDARDERLAATLREAIPMHGRENPQGFDYHSRVALQFGRGVRLVHVDETPFDLGEVV
jgi:hypothetical protein